MMLQHFHTEEIFSLAFTYLQTGLCCILRISSVIANIQRSRAAFNDFISFQCPYVYVCVINIHTPNRLLGPTNMVTLLAMTMLPTLITMLCFLFLLFYFASMHR